jgi:hypothetical protein
MTACALSATPTTQQKPTTEPKHYLRNPELLVEIRLSRRARKITPRLAVMFMELADRNSMHPWYVGYPGREDMVSEAVIYLCTKWRKFDPRKSDNPFAYFTAVVRDSFRKTLRRERAHIRIVGEVHRAVDLYDLRERGPYSEVT